MERDLDYGDAPYHGDAGPITIRRYPAGRAAAAASGLSGVGPRARLPGLPGRQRSRTSWGSGPQPMNKLGRLRVSCAVGYLAPARIRPNLTIQADSLVHRLITENGRCTGRGGGAGEGELSEIRGKLVVVSAGAILSPAILMRSGIGPERTSSAGTASRRLPRSTRRRPEPLRPPGAVRGLPGEGRRASSTSTRPSSRPSCATRPRAQTNATTCRSSSSASPADGAARRCSASPR